MNKQQAKKLPYPPRYISVLKSSVAAQEKGDCAIRAVAILTDIPYCEVRKLFTNFRIKGGGVYNYNTIKIMEQLGYHIMRQHPQTFISKFPRAYRHKKLITTHSFDRFPEAFPKGKMLVTIREHIFAVIDGVVQDMIRGHSYHCVNIYKVEKQS